MAGRIVYNVAGQPIQNRYSDLPIVCVIGPVIVVTMIILTPSSFDAVIDNLGLGSLPSMRTENGTTH
jgi:hypothetical protein